MPNKRTVALTKNQYEEIISTMFEGGAGFRPNIKIATALVLEANLGMRIEDILSLKLCDFIRDGARFRLDVVEQKTKKVRNFTVPNQIYQYVENYCYKNKLASTDQLFSFGERAVQKYLKKVVDYIGLENIGTHSFRKFFATDIYEHNGHNIILVQQLLQHSSPIITQHYIGISSEMIESALQEHIHLL